MASRFSELQLCDLDWKAEQIATDNYPSWHNTWQTKKQSQQLEKENSLITFPDDALQSKRPSQGSSKEQLKHARIVNSNSDAEVAEAKELVVPISKSVSISQLFAISLLYQMLFGRPT